MPRKNPFIIIIASVAGIFFVATLLLFSNIEILQLQFKLKDFDTIMGVGVGVNLALGVLRGIRESICSYFKLRFSRVKSSAVDRSKYLLDKKSITEDQAKGIESSIDNLSWSIENNKAHEIVQNGVVFTAIIAAAVYITGLTVSAYSPLYTIIGFAGVLLVLFILLPVGLYVLLISLLAAFPEHQLMRAYKTLNGFGELTGNNHVTDQVNPIAPHK